jgi:hypothetical protein
MFNQYYLFKSNEKKHIFIFLLFLSVPKLFAQTYLDYFNSTLRQVLSNISCVVFYWKVAFRQLYSMGQILF